MHLWKHTLACTCLGLLAFSPLPAVGADKTQSLCTPEETLLFTCPMEGKRLASVCASSNYGPDSGYVLFRQGVAGKTELTLPATQTVPSKAAKRGSWMFAGGGGAYLQFADGNTTYTVFSATGRWGDNGESVDRAGVATTTDGRVTNRPCTKLSNSELGPEFFDKAGFAEADPEFEMPE